MFVCIYLSVCFPGKNLHIKTIGVNKVENQFHLCNYLFYKLSDTTKHKIHVRNDFSCRRLKFSKFYFTITDDTS